MQLLLTGPVGAVLAVARQQHGMKLVTWNVNGLVCAVLSACVQTYRGLLSDEC